MQFSQKQRENLVKKLTEFITEHECAVCHSKEWTIAERIYAMSDYYPHGFVPTGFRVPFVVLSCAKCAHSILFNAIGLGIVDAKTGELTDG